jgi:hypothetical protein
MEIEDYQRAPETMPHFCVTQMSLVCFTLLASRSPLQVAKLQFIFHLMA